MKRFLLHYLLPFLTPFVLYALWLYLSRGKVNLGAVAVPWVWLLTAGLALVAISLAALALTGDNPIGGEYTPPRYVDGEVVPGQVD